MENKFNLEEAMAGKPVQTRDGRAVTQLKFFEDVNLNLIVGVVDRNIWTWDIKGQSDRFRGETNIDLFMAPEKKSVWVNVYEIKNGNMWVQPYLTKEDANKFINDLSELNKYIKTIEITNEP